MTSLSLRAFGADELPCRIANDGSPHGVYVLGSFIFGLPSDRPSTFEAVHAQPAFAPGLRADFYRQMYANTGIATDSARVNRANRWARLIARPRPADFDWPRCLGPDACRAEWIAAAIALAHELLGADVTGVPIVARTGRVPAWLSRAVLRGWGRAAGDLSDRPPGFRALIGSLGESRRFREEWQLRWDRPIQATIELNAPIKPAAPAPVATRDRGTTATQIRAHFGLDGTRALATELLTRDGRRYLWICPRLRSAARVAPGVA